MAKTAEYLALDEEHINLFFSMQEVRNFDLYWKNGVDIWRIAESLKRDPDEIAILLIDRVRKGKVDERENGAKGTRTA